MSTWTKNQLIRLFEKLPLWGKIALPAGAIILVIAILKTLGTIIKVAAIALLIFGLISLFNTWKKDQEEA